MKKLLTLLLLLPLMYGCMSKKPLTSLPVQRPCQSSGSVFRYDSLVYASAALSGKIDSAQFKTLSARFSNRSLSIARDLNILPLLYKLQDPEDQKGAQHSSALSDKIAIRAEISERISLASLDIASTMAEIDCEKERTLEAQDYLQGWIDKRLNRLNVAAIAIGAVAGVATSALTLAGEGDNIVEGTAIAGGLVGVYLTVKTSSLDKKVVFSHPRNHLAEVWNHPKYSRIFPPTVWSFMTKEFKMEGKTTTGRQILIEQWQKTGLLPITADGQAPLQCGEGSYYSVEDLHNRIKMLQTLESAIDLMKYDLKRLQQEVILGYKPE